jgi:putative FmdB family regulatory protein
VPIYEYRCSECGVHFDKLQRFGDPAPDTCPYGHQQVQRLFSQPAIIFKGSGFYVTDNGRNGRSATSSNKRKSEKAKAKD